MNRPRPIARRRTRLRSPVAGVLLAARLASSGIAAAEPASPDTDPRWRVLPGPATMPDIPLAIPDSPVLVHSLGAAAESLARRTAPTAAAAWRTRRPEVDRQFRLALGLLPAPERTPLQARVVGRQAFAGYAVENVVWESRPGLPVTANLYLPEGPATERHAAVLSPIGHYLTAGKTATVVQERCLGLVQQGFVVLAYDALGQGERMVPGNIHHEAGYALLPLGQTIAGWMVWDSQRALDYLASRPEVDPERIGLTGNSGGGLNTLFTAALDPRIHAATVVGFTFEFGNWLKYGGTHCTCTHLPGIFPAMNWDEIAGLTAPRPLLMIQGADDGIFPISGARRSGERVARIYAAEGVPDLARFVELAGLPHAYSRPFREVMYGWMHAHLRPEGRGDPRPEPGLEPLPENDPRLLCDPSHQFLPGAPTVVQLARRQALERLAALPDLQAPDRAQAVRGWVARLTAPPEMHPHLLAPWPRAPKAKADGGPEKVSFNSEDGLRLPALLWKATGPRRGHTVVVADSRGKAAVAESPGPAELTAAGFDVVAVDLRGRGETLGRHAPGYDGNFRLVANQVLAGAPLPGRRAFDLRRTLDFLVTRPDLATNTVSVMGAGDDTLPVLLAAVGDPRIRQVVLAGGVHSLVSLMRARTPPDGPLGDAWNDPQLRGRIRTGDGEGEVDFGSVIPGALAVADLPELVALLAPRRVWFGAATDRQAPDHEALEARFRRLTGGGTFPTLTYEPAKEPAPGALGRWLAGEP